MATTIDLIYFNAGGGHRSAAMALDAVIREQGRPWTVRPLNLCDVLDPKGLFRKATGMDPEDLYNVRLARGWTLGLAQELKLFQGMIRLSHDSLTRRLQRHWRRTKPDLVVSLVPNFNRAMYEACAPRIPFVTVMTDFADYPPHFWLEPNQAQHVICGTPTAAAQALAAGFAKSQVHLTSGMIIRPEFYRERDFDRRAERSRLGLDPDRPTGIVLFGGHGSKVMKSINRELADTQLIFVCGHNETLAARLRKTPSVAPRAVLGFTPDIPYYMRLSDFFIGKPGPGSISEAVQQRLPVIVVRNAWTMPQERFNPEWVLQNGAGIVLSSFKAVAAGVEQMVEQLPLFKARVERIRNRAVFEIPELLQHIMAAPPPRPTAHYEPVAFGLSRTPQRAALR